MNTGKRANLLAATIIAVAFVVLAVWPLTRDALRFDMQMAAGRPVLRGVLTDMGVKQDALPFAGLGPQFGASRPDAGVEPSLARIDKDAMAVCLAGATQLPGRDKWNALQQLVADFPDNPAGHAALVRMACKNGGTVDVGHVAEQEELSPHPSTASTPPTATVRRNGTDPQDIVVMLRSCAAGERLHPDNAYFPAMAAIAYYSANEDEAAHAALHRAAQKTIWREYFDVEAAGRVRRAELLQGPQNSLTESATLASMLFPHYAGLRAMARVATAQAMHSEQAGDIEAGLALRRDVARLGAKMREQSSSLIGCLVGIAITGVSEQRPGGTPLITSSGNDGGASRLQTHVQFLEYLAHHGAREDAGRSLRYWPAGEATKAIVHRASYVSVFGAATMFQTQWKLLTGMFLLSAAMLLCVLGGIAQMRPWLGMGTGRAATGVVVAIFVAVMLWMSWHVLGNVRDIFALSNVFSGLSGDDTVDQALAQAERAALLRTLYLEGTLSLFALLTPTVYLTLMAVMRAKRFRGGAVERWLDAGALPLAALLTVVYAGHLVAFSVREQTVRAELQQVVTHEGRYAAEKLGRAWPETPD